jgi:hypothetical protein
MEKREGGIQKKISLREIFSSKKNLKRDIIITAISVVFAALWIISSFSSPSGKNPRVLSGSIVEDSSEQVIKQEIREIENENKSKDVCVGEASNPFEVLIETKEEIQEPKPVIYKPRITAPKPLAETKRDGLGRQVCAKENDKPSKSKKHKGRNMDMECCLDPDEYPNPWCYYPPEKYGKLLDKLS